MDEKCKYLDEERKFIRFLTKFFYEIFFAIDLS